MQVHLYIGIHSAAVSGRVVNKAMEWRNGYTYVLVHELQVVLPQWKLTGTVTVYTSRRQ